MRTSLDMFSLTHRIFLVKNYYQEFGNYSCVKSNYEDHYGTFSNAPAFSEVALQEVIRLFENTGSVRRNPLQDIRNPANQEIRKDRNSERVNLSSRSLKCESCRKSFLYLSNLKRHILDTHELEDAYKCHVCSLDLRVKHKFLMHMKSHEEAPEASKTLLDKFKQCMECGKMCPISIYYEHILIHGDQHYKCNACGKEFTWQGAYKLHKMKHEGIVEKKNWPHCLLCGQQMAGQRTLKIHMEKIHPKVNTSQRFNEVIEHYPDEVEMVEIKFEEEDPFSESQTPYSESIVALPLEVDPLDTNNDPNEVLSDQHDDSSDHFPEEEYFGEAEAPSLDQTDVKDAMALCELCGKVLSFHGLRKHLKVAHSDDLPYKCPVEGCNKAYKWSGSYHWHVMTHDKTKGKQYKCKVCERSFNYSYLLKNHIIDRHRDLAFYCEPCDRLFVEKSEFVWHLREWHKAKEDDPLPTNSKPPPPKPKPTCMICGKIFTYRQNIKSHMKSHAKGEEAFKCPEPGCGKSFPIEKYLNLHLMRHSGQRFKCAHCEKDYADRKQLKLHIKQIHLNEKPRYRCKMCEYGSWHSDSFRTHARREHGIDNPFPKRNLKYMSGRT